MVIAQEGFSSMNQSRCTITGRFAAVEEDAEKAAAREGYLKRHPEVQRPFAVGRNVSHRFGTIAFFTAASPTLPQLGQTK